MTLSFGALPEGVSGGDIGETSVTIREVALRSTVSSGGGGGGGVILAPAVPAAPAFPDGTQTSRSLAPNARPGDAVGSPVAATHPGLGGITYSLSGDDASLFTIDGETGQIRLGQGASLEAGRTYTVNVTGSVGTAAGATIAVTIEVAALEAGHYDLDGSGRVEKDEVLRAVSDYFAGLIDKETALEVVSLYFAQ